MRRDGRALRSVLLAVGATALVLLAAPRVSAADAPAPIRVTYTAPAACPARSELLARVFARTSNARAAAPDDTARELVVRVESVGRRFRGRVVIAPGGGSGTPSGPGSGAAPAGPGAPHEREVTSAKCDDLIDALAFFIALAVDEDATTSSPAPPPAPPPAPLAAPPPAPAPAAPLPLGPRDTSPPPEPVTDRSRWRVSGGTGLALVGGIAPTVVLGNRVAVHVTRDERDAWLAPSFTLGGVSTATASAQNAAGSLALRWRTLFAAACPIVVTAPAASSLSLRPCAVLEAGVLRGDGVGILRARRNDAFWLAAGLALRGDLGVTQGLHLEAEVGASAPLDHPRFVYSTGAVAFDTPPLGFRGSLLLVLHL